MAVVLRILDYSHPNPPQHRYLAMTFLALVFFVGSLLYIM